MSNPDINRSTSVLLAMALCLLSAARANADVPQTSAELWADFPAMDKATPLEAEVHKSWE